MAIISLICVDDTKLLQNSRHFNRSDSFKTKSPFVLGVSEALIAQHDALEFRRCSHNNQVQGQSDAASNYIFVIYILRVYERGFSFFSL